MNTLTTYLPKPTSKTAGLLDASKVRVWAFSAAVRLSDQDKPIALKLLVEVAIAIRMLAELARTARCATGKTVIAHRSALPSARAAARRSNPAKRAVTANVRQPRIAAVQRKRATQTVQSAAVSVVNPRLKREAKRAQLKHPVYQGASVRRSPYHLGR